MEVVPDYEDRGMKKWRPFYSSPELRLSLNSVMNEFKLPYQAPSQITAEEIDLIQQRQTSPHLAARRQNPLPFRQKPLPS